MITILVTVFILGALIFFHELGHFLVAKWAGIAVEKFSLGVPPTIISRKFGETEYCLGLIPLGGFVKMIGENPDEETTGAPHEFMSKPIRIRTAVIAAGPFMNLVMAWIVLCGIFMYQGEVVVDPDHAVIGVVAPGMPAEKAGLMPGDVVTSINGTPVKTFSDLSRLISSQPDKEVTIVWQRQGQEMSAAVTTNLDKVYNDQGEKVPIGKLGVLPQIDYQPVGILGAMRLGSYEIKTISEKIVVFVWHLVTLQVSPKAVGGPVFIAQMAGQTAQMGILALLYFMAFLSVNLAILNVLPIPVLDGGHLVFLFIEKIKGTPLTLNQRMIAQQVGLVFLLLVIVMVTYNDIVRFITG